MEDIPILSLDSSFDEIIETLKNPEKGISIKKRTWMLKSYKNCFIGSELIDWLIKFVDGIDSRVEALAYAGALEEARYFRHVSGDHPIKDEKLFYRFRDVDDLEFFESTNRSWSKNYFGGSEFGTDLGSDSDGGFLPLIGELEDDMIIAAEELEVSPLDEWNTKLLDNVHPSNWENPDPQDVYNIVVIGAGSGGLVTAAIGAGVGAKVALIEKHLMGGDCLNVGCVPSKALIRCAESIYQAKNSEQFGVFIDGEVVVDFPAIMERMRKIRADISHLDSAQRFHFDLGVDVFIGEGVFTSKNTVQVGDKTLKFSKAVIATGARAAIPPIPGLEDVRYLTNATLFNLTELPERFGVIGSGAIGCEMAQSFRRFGSEVVVFSRSATIMSREDPEAVAVLIEQFEKEGIIMENNVTYEEILTNDVGEIEVHYTVDDEPRVQVFDELLIATGRKPNVKGIGLEDCGVKFSTRTGVKVNDMLQTKNSNIYAVGDCCSNYKFTHMADNMARLVIRNCLFFGSSKVSQLTIPWATFTHPEIAHVGPYEWDMEEKGIKWDVYQLEFEHNDRAICDGATEGFVKIYTKQGTDTVIAGTIVGESAGNMISVITTLIVHKIGLGDFASTIHPYPTTGDAVRRTGDLFNRTKMTTFVKIVFRKLMAAKR